MGKHGPPWRDGAVILLASLALSACSAAALAPVDLPTRGSLPPTSAPPTGAQTVRVIVKFRQAVPFREAAFLQAMAQHIQAHIAYISSVAPDTHVYRVEPQPGQCHADILQRLASLPTVLRVEADAVARPF